MAENKNSRWWERLPARFQMEVEEMKSATDAVMEIKDGKVIWYESIKMPSESYNIKIVCQKRHPREIAKVHILKPKLLWNTPHMWSEGNIDIGIGYKEDNSRLTILDVWYAACEWIIWYEGYKKGE